MDENAGKTRQRLEARLINRALKDDTFREELVRDPRAVFARELGIQMPEHIQVQVLEESPSTVYLVLPQRLPGAGTEFSDADLEAVAGGYNSSDYFTCPAVATCEATCYTGCETCDAAWDCMFPG